MAENTKIEWCHATFNPWRGCTKVSPGCAHCYAETLSHRNPQALGEWGPTGKRVIAAESYWRQPVKWNRAAAAAGERHRVFCASLADVFENRTDLVEPRRRLFRLIEDTPALEWLLLTKRPEFMVECLTRTCLYGDGWLTHPRPNVWLGVSVEDKARKARIDLLRSTPAAVRFLSVEPLLEDIGTLDLTGISWVIVGGESGPDARPCDMAWVDSIVSQCRAAEVACFVKQLGSRPVSPQPLCPIECPCGLHHGFADRKGGDPDEWPVDLRVRQFPAQPAGV